MPNESERDQFASAMALLQGLSQAIFVAKDAAGFAEGMPADGAAVERTSTSIRLVSERIRASRQSILAAAGSVDAARGAVGVLAETAGHIEDAVRAVQLANLLTAAAGHGFGGMAGEVRALAHETVVATEHIARQIESIRSAARRFGS